MEIVKIVKGSYGIIELAGELDSWTVKRFTSQSFTDILKTFETSILKQFNETLGIIFSLGH